MRYAWQLFFRSSPGISPAKLGWCHLVGGENGAMVTCASTLSPDVVHLENARLHFSLHGTVLVFGLCCLPQAPKEEQKQQ